MLSWNVKFEHFGIPRTLPQYFEECVRCCSIGHLNNLDKFTVISLWNEVASMGEIHQPTRRQTFELIWDLLVPADLQRIDHDHFYIGVYLVRAHVEGCILPTKLPFLALDRIFSWFRESVWIYTDSLNCPPAIS
ncbi:hypothetical protein K439DRAFT_172409, partial [Ramaria rubella]